MRVLFDTRILVWAAEEPERLSPAARALVADPAVRPVFSAVVIWEVAIKFGLRRAGFRADPRALRRGLLRSGYEELPVTGAHAQAVVGLPPVHGDPFDRIMLAQALVEGIPFATADRRLAAYPAEVRLLA